jgi:uncharacterized protein HemY
MGDGPGVVAARNEEGRSDVTQERWREVKAILARALERAPEERCAYLDEAYKLQGDTAKARESYQKFLTL